MLLSGAVNALPVTPDESLVDHWEGILSSTCEEGDRMLVLIPPTPYSHTLEESDIAPNIYKSL